ncbi:MAG TPA: glycosyltransferase [Myxococcota bacterium]|nr:glycosyltransferase [Myxococcota bacterium]
MTAPRVSVLMPVHDTARWVEAACESILRQTLRELELVVIDDGSSDDSAERLRALAARDPRVRLSCRHNLGLVATRNELLARARAPLVAWMDSDDLSVPERLALQLTRFEAEPTLVCLGGSVLELDPDGEPLQRICYPAEHEAIAEAMTRAGAMRFPTTMMRRQAALDAGGFREPFPIGEDFDLCWRLLERGRLANLQQVVLHYRLHPHSASQRLGARWAAYRDAILELARERRETGSDRLQRGEGLQIAATSSGPATDDLVECHQRFARQALASGYGRVARKHARRVLALAPAKLGSWKLAARVAFDSSRQALTHWAAPRRTS